MTRFGGFVGAPACRRSPQAHNSWTIPVEVAMFLDIGLPLASGGHHRVAYIARVARALDRRRLAAVALVTLLLSFGPLISSELFDFFSPAEIAVAWFEH